MSIFDTFFSTSFTPAAHTCRWGLRMEASHKILKGSQTVRCARKRVDIQGTVNVVQELGKSSIAPQQRKGKRTESKKNPRWSERS